MSCRSSPSSTAPITPCYSCHPLPACHYGILRCLTLRYTLPRACSLTHSLSLTTPASLLDRSHLLKRSYTPQHVAFLIAIVGPRVTISRLHSSVKIVLSDRHFACQPPQHAQNTKNFANPFYRNLIHDHGRPTRLAEGSRERGPRPQ